jgi:hypothetical protein
MEKTRITVLVVNLHQPAMTLDVVDDLRKQDAPCEIVVFDQSKELSYDDLKGCVLSTPKGDPWHLCHVWNHFASGCAYEFLCLLNSDCRVPHNFISDTLHVFDKEPEVAIVCHPVNVPGEAGSKGYFIPKQGFVQGCDFTIRAMLWPIIPSDIKVWGGDDWVFHQIYKQGLKAAVATTSPILHYKRQSHRWATVNRDEDVAAWKRFGFDELPHKAPVRP